MRFLVNINYNLDFAKNYGINAAILLNYIQTEYHEQNVTISINREIVKQLTALNELEQEEAEFVLKKLGLIETKPYRNNGKKYYCNFKNDRLIEIFSAKDLSTIVEKEVELQIAVVSKPTTKPKLSKRDYQIINFKKRIKVEDPVIQDYFIKWVDAVYENPKGYLTSVAVDQAQKELNEYSKGNQKIQIEVLNIASKNGYRDMLWAIDRHKNNQSNKNTNTPISFANYNEIKATESDKYKGEIF